VRRASYQFRADVCNRELVSFLHHQAIPMSSDGYCNKLKVPVTLRAMKSRWVLRLEDDSTWLSAARCGAARGQALANGRFQVPLQFREDLPSTV